jgi:hypothetical protein
MDLLFRFHLQLLGFLCRRGLLLKALRLLLLLPP